ncbi:MAG: cation transporter [Candidatus Aenigmatarchaeota archaeon]
MENKTSREEVIDIKGMHCNSCVKLIESRIGSMKGVDNIKVDLIKNNAHVSFNSEETSLDKINSEIETLGYSIYGDTKEIANNKKNKTIIQGIAYGLVPHIGCIAFIVGSILGVTLLMEFFRPILMNRYFFHILMLISIGFATLSSVLYLKRNTMFSFAGAKRKWQYLSTMYGSTIGINLVLFMLIFPMLANLPTASATGVVGFSNPDDVSLLKMSVEIPCPGHAPLISSELKTINGVLGVQFSFPNVFDVKYDSTMTSKAEMLSLEVFKEYPANVLEETSSPNEINSFDSAPVASSEGGSCGGSAGGGCGCGGVE